MVKPNCKSFAIPSLVLSPFTLLIPQTRRSLHAARVRLSKKFFDRNEGAAAPSFIPGALTRLLGQAKHAVRYTLRACRATFWRCALFQRHGGVEGAKIPSCRSSGAWGSRRDSAAALDSPFSICYYECIMLVSHFARPSATGRRMLKTPRRMILRKRHARGEQQACVVACRDTAKANWEGKT